MDREVVGEESGRSGMSFSFFSVAGGFSGGVDMLTLSDDVGINR